MGLRIGGNLRSVVSEGARHARSRTGSETSNAFAVENSGISGLLPCPACAFPDLAMRRSMARRPNASSADRFVRMWYVIVDLLCRIKLGISVLWAP